MSRLFHEFYVQPMFQVYIETITIFVIWTVAMSLLRQKARRVTVLIGTIAALFLVLMFTVLNRQSAGVREVSLVPFVTFINAQTEPELYRTMYMNMLLFLPLGLSLPFALYGKIKHTVLISIGIGFLFSVGVEAAQYFFLLGRCETDDVIMNTLGVLIGSMSFIVFYVKDKRINSKRDWE